MLVYFTLPYPQVREDEWCDNSV